MRPDTHSVHQTEVHYEELSHQVSPGTSCTNLGSSLDQVSMAAILDVEEEHIQGSLRFSLFYDQLFLTRLLHR